MSRRPTTSLTYRPALDGLRAVAVLGVLVFHLWPHAARGGWLGVDLFFVLSGYLITTLLVREYSASGRLDLRRFWLARARRLMPSLVVVLLSVLVAASFWTIPSRRGSVSGDVVATLLYYANWRFLLGDEAYFNANGTPSPLRHAWSLAIEEQYYLFFPIILLIIARFVHRRRSLSFIFAVLAAASAAWMAYLYVPGVDPTRVYYGTDTRAFELLIGAAAGAWVGPRQWGHRTPGRWLRVVERAAWPALVLLVVGFFTLSENVELLFRGGFVIFAVLCLAPILAAASPHPNSFQRVLALEPLRRLGLISYALYLWHWPVHVFLTPSRLGLDDTAAGLAQAATSVVLAALTYRYVEAPIRRGGLAALLPRRRGRRSRPTAAPVLAAGALALVLLGALGLPRLSYSGPAEDTGAGGANLVFQPAAYTPGADQRVILVGNSIPHSLVAHFPATRFPDIDLSESTSFGCSTVTGQEIFDGEAKPVSAECRTFQKTWYLGLQGADRMLFFLPQNLLHDYLVDGRRLVVGTPEHDAHIRSTLDEVQRRTHQMKLGQPTIVNLACHDMPSFTTAENDVTVLNDIPKVRHLNGVASSWAKEHGVQVIDQFGFLCGGGRYHGTIDGQPLYEDALHFTAFSGPLMWSWLAPQLRAGAGSRAQS